MNLLKNPTIEELQILLLSCNYDECYHIVWVDNNAEVRITPFTEDFWKEYKTEIFCNFAPYFPGNGYVGVEAAQDITWVRELFNRLLRSWNLGY